MFKFVYTRCQRIILSKMWTFDILDCSIINVLSDFKNLKI